MQSIMRSVQVQRFKNTHNTEPCCKKCKQTLKEGDNIQVRYSNGHASYYHQTCYEATFMEVNL